MRNISRSVSPLIVACACLFGSTAYADSGLYIGGSVGNANFGFEKPKGGDFELDNFDLDDSDLGFKVYSGFKFTMAAVEVGYVDFGEIKSGDGSGSVTGLNAFGILSMGLGPVSVFAKAGGFVWETDVDIAEEKYKEDGFDPALGFGARFQLGDISVRAEYEYYDIEGLDKLSMISVGAAFWLL